MSGEVSAYIRIAIYLFLTVTVAQAGIFDAKLRRATFATAGLFLLLAFQALLIAIDLRTLRDFILENIQPLYLFFLAAMWVKDVWRVGAR